MDIRTRRLVLNLPVAVLLTAALAPAVASASSAHASFSPRSLPTWAHGSITGAGPHAGVRLELVVWPGTKKIRVGQKVGLQVVGRTTSTSTGSYAIHPTVRLRRGIHNLEILARSRVAVGAFSFPRRVARGGLALVAVDGRASSGPVTANIHMMALPRSERSPARSPLIGGCIPVAIKIRELGNRMVDVGGLYSLMIDGKMKETYSAGSNTTIGVGISVEGDNGGFSLGGTSTQTSSGSEGFPTLTGKIVNEQTPYTFGEYEVCLIHQVQSEAWATGRHEQNVKPPPLNGQCGFNFGPGGTFTRSSGTAGTFSAGVDLKKVIGIDLSAQSGYNQNVSIKYTFPSEGGFLCGTNNFPSVASFDIMDPCSASGYVQSPLGNTTRPAERTSRSR